MPFVLDASVAMAWCFQDEASEQTDLVLEMLDTDVAFVPTIWPLEVANALLAGELRGRLQAARTVRFVDLIRSLPIEIALDLRVEGAFGPLLEIARDYNLSVYDASYLDLAMRQALPLATSDRQLITAASQAGVQLVL